MHRSLFVGSNSDPSHGTWRQANDVSQHTSQDTREKWKNTSGGPICNCCKCRGHLISECLSLEKQKANATSNAVVQLIHKQPVTQQVLRSCEPYNDDYRSSVSDGQVSLTEDGEVVPVKILQDTGETQSLLAANVLLLSEKTSIETSVLIQRVELGIISVLFCKVYLWSELVCGPVIIGVRLTLPVQGASLILGNNLEGGMVKPKLPVVK